jgi:ABC-type sugar transport system ATPase subunit
MASISLLAVSKQFDSGTHAVRDVHLEIADGELLVLVGPSGSGKSTVLRLIAGLDTPTSGRILIDGEDVTAVPPQHRDLAMVFQSYALYPHMSVRDNLAYGLKVRRTDPSVVVQRVADVASALELDGLLDRRPAQLSGGQRQRVALGRAIVRQPRAFLLDEPLSNLDPSLRAQARAELRRLHQRLGVTVVYVTHDQEEAISLGARVGVMRNGAIEQVAPPLDVYARPANRFVAGFIGAPPMNFVRAALLGVDAPPGAVAGIRPQDVCLGARGVLPAVVELVEPRGADTLVHVQPDAADFGTLLVVTAGAEPPPVGARLFLGFPPEKLHLFDGANGTRL